MNLGLLLKTEGRGWFGSGIGGLVCDEAVGRWGLFFCLSMLALRKILRLTMGGGAMALH